MMGKTHLVFGAFVGFLYLQFVQPHLFTVSSISSIIVFILILFGSLLPDVDHKNSKFGKNVKIIGILFQHRGFFHSIFAVVMWYFVFSLFLKSVFVYAIILGYVSHILLDCLNSYGIKPIAPFFKLHIRGPFYTNQMEEKIMFYGLILANFAFILQYSLKFDISWLWSLLQSIL